MKRREFLKSAAVGVGAVGVQGGCATARPTESSLFSTEFMDAFLGQFDRGMAAIDRGAGLGPLGAGDGYPDQQAMAKRALRSLYAVGSFADLEIEQQAHPAIQARMERLLPEMARSLRECTAFVDSATPEVQRCVRDALREDPSLPLQLAESVDDAGDAVGVSPRTRRKFRLAATQVGFRLRHHDPMVLAGEYVQKVRKVEAWSGDEARLQRQIAARVGQEALVADQARFAAARQRWIAMGAADDGDSAAPAPSTSDENPGSGALRAAAWCFGLGLAAGAVGGIIVAASGGVAGAFPLTAAVILVLIALILLIVGLAKGGGGSPKPTEDESNDPGLRSDTPPHRSAPAAPDLAPASRET